MLYCLIVLANFRGWLFPQESAEAAGLAVTGVNPELGVVLKGSDEVDYQVMVSVLDTLRQLDITKMGLATE